MTITTNSTMDEVSNHLEETPGQQLMKLREQRGFTQEYVALKLHLRVRIIELLENDQYTALPEPVFIKGYMRAYAKLLNVPHEPLLAFYNRLNIADRKIEKALWQGRRETNVKEKMVRWMSLAAVVVIIIATAFWWQKAKETPLIAKAKAVPLQNAKFNGQDSNNLTSLSKIQSMFTLKSDTVNTEKQSG